MLSLTDTHRGKQMSEEISEVINEEEVLECSICGGDIAHHSHEGRVYWTLGHNAQPVNDGRCCDNCNDTVVIPFRLVGHGHPPEYAKAIGELMASESYKNGAKKLRDTMDKSVWVEAYVRADGTNVSGHYRTA